MMLQPAPCVGLSMRSCLIKGRFVRASIFTISRAGHLLIKGTIVLTCMSYEIHPARDESAP